MKPTNEKIIVRANMEQKDSIEIDGVSFLSALKFEVNHREKSPVIAQVVSGNEMLSEGDILLCHHNTFYEPSPYYLKDDLFSIPANGNILFAKIYRDGTLAPIYGNTICKKVDIETPLPLPPSQRKQHINRAVIIDGGWTKFKKDQLIFFRPYANYDIVYVWEGVEVRVTKVFHEQICGVVFD